jgi:tetrapyrrole methylase family protein/MazG family protein
MTNDKTPAEAALTRLLDIMERLRAPDGCAWDREQTPATLKPQMLEECYEVLEAIDSGSPTHLTEELGDLLLHVIFQAQIARESGQFDFAAVAQGVADKLVRRHPHVFGTDKTKDPDQIVARWNELKKLEKPERRSVLDGVPRALPALMRAEALQKKARQVGFDWPDVGGSLDKVREETAEIAAELELAKQPNPPAETKARMGEEIGDLLFSVVNLARHLKLNAEDLLTAASDKFVTRFTAMEQTAQSEGRELSKLPLSELDALWDRVKRQ